MISIDHRFSIWFSTFPISNWFEPYFCFSFGDLHTSLSLKIKLTSALEHSLNEMMRVKLSPAFPVWDSVNSLQLCAQLKCIEIMYFLKRAALILQSSIRYDDVVKVNKCMLYTVFNVCGNSVHHSKNSIPKNIDERKLYVQYKQHFWIKQNKNHSNHQLCTI